MVDISKLHPEDIQFLEKARREFYAQRAKRAMQEKAKAGIFPGCAPLGYKNVTIDGKKVIVPDPEIAPLVKELFRLSKKRGMTIRKLVKWADEVGLKSRNGKPLGPSSIHLILNNPFYGGMMRYERGMVGGTHLALITKKGGKL